MRLHDIEYMVVTPSFLVAVISKGIVERPRYLAPSYGDTGLIHTGVLVQYTDVDAPI